MAYGLFSLRAKIPARGSICIGKRLKRSWLPVAMVLPFLAFGRISFGQPESQLPSDMEAAMDMAYGPLPRESLDLFYSTKRVLPLVIFIHGGGWESGDKSEDLAEDWTLQGYAIASINYRYSSDAIFPAQLQDGKAAVRWLRAHAAAYHIDPTRFAVFGESSGGHIAALVGTTGAVRTYDVGGDLNESSAVQAVVDFYGPTDLSLYGPSKSGDGLTRLFGAVTASVPEQVTAANPIHYVTPGDPPFFVAHGDSDHTVPISHSLALVAALEKAGVQIQFHLVPGGEHGFEGLALQEALQAARLFLDKTLKESDGTR